ncbi:hypothetical protein [Streptomyces sp. NPDC059816]|uniref:hypothetical protein n=1 Tax=Streptomyces sp. NPDC059816 TaxID=3346960 RepID=UPI00364E3DC6
MPTPALLPARIPDAPAPDLVRTAVRPARPLPATPGAAPKGTSPAINPAAEQALVRTALILDPGRRLSCTRWGIARRRRELARHVRRLLPIAEQGRFAGRAREIVGRADLLLAQCRRGRGLGALIAVVQAAEKVRELAVLTHPEPDVLRAACRPAVAGRAR